MIGQEFTHHENEDNLLVSDIKLFSRNKYNASCNINDSKIIYKYIPMMICFLSDKILKNIQNNLKKIMNAVGISPNKFVFVFKIFIH